MVAHYIEDYELIGNKLSLSASYLASHHMVGPCVV